MEVHANFVQQSCLTLAPLAAHMHQVSLLFLIILGQVLANVISQVLVANIRSGAFLNANPQASCS